ncbi:hypothetical protein CK203_028385 [Vitis vinifera]|uniref:Reverse transcriptase zinc-binding domain-containing protein n=1 Tax=Vitis vinifera TaxID=29760 RepID=A0A438J0A6_VITVI|nr:hypothetical protein CK203_028385 [Vitis vinifera]
MSEEEASWEASWGRVLTLDNLQKRGQPLANRCYMCKQEGESICGNPV